MSNNHVVVKRHNHVSLLVGLLMRVVGHEEWMDMLKGDVKH